MRIKSGLKAAVSAMFLLAMPAFASGAPAMKSTALSPAPLLSAKKAAGIANSPSGKNASGKKSGKELPVINGKVAVASVNGDPITVGEFNRVLIKLHNSLKGKETGKKATAERIDYAGVLDRLINVSLAGHEAKRIGLDQLPMVKVAIKAYSDRALEKMIRPDNLQGVKPDPILERNIYRAQVEEFRIKSAVFDIKQFAEETQTDIHTQKAIDEQKRAADLLNQWAGNVKPGDSFDKVVKAAIKRGFAVGNLKGVYVKKSKMPPPVAAIVSRMRVGQTSPMLRAGVNKFVILQLLGVRYPGGDKKAMEVAKRQATAIASAERVDEYLRKLEKKYLTLNVGLIHSLDKLDYTSKSFNLYKLEEDKRVLAVVKGGEPVTVGELALAIDKKFYHGLRTASISEVLTAKNKILTGILEKRALRQQALAEGLQNARIYKDEVEDYKRTLMFGMFMDRVVAPDVKLVPGDSMAYYKKHIEDYSVDGQMRVRALVFKKEQDARNAILSLKRGDEFHWVRANAQGQLPAGQKGLVDFGDSLVYVNDFPVDAQNVLKGAKEGDARLYEGPGADGAKKLFYVLYVEKEVPPVPKPFKQVKDEIERKVYGERFEKVAGNWFAKLRKAYNVKIYDETLQMKMSDAGKK